MRPHMSLSMQVLCLVIIPLVVQLISLGVLASLQNELDNDLRKADRARRIADTVHAICADMYDAMAKGSGEKHRTVEMPDDKLYGLPERFEANYKTLKAATKDNSQDYQIVIKSETAAREILKVFHALQLSINTQSEEEGREYRKPLWKAIREKSKVLLNQDLIDLGASQKLLANKSPEKQAEIRERIQSTLFFAGMFNLICLPLIAAIWVRGFALKVKTINDNQFRLASNLPLNPVLEGEDELAKLDSVFHRMASELQESARKERALLDNAKDLICSIDAGGKFVAINPAAESLLGYHQDELIGAHLVDLIAPDDAGRALSYLDKIKNETDAAPLELTLRRKDGTFTEVVLSAHYEQTENSIFCVVHDITARKQAERLRQEVVAMVTHDLRTPLGTVKNVLDFLESGNFGNLDEKGNRYVISGQRNVDRMMTLINDLLDVEKISSGRMELDLEVFELDDCFQNCSELHGGLAEEAGVKLNVVPTDIVIKADHEKLQRVLSNLVTNAIKFSPSGGTVTVSAESLVMDGSSRAQIKVEDQGSGIPEDQIESVFERFQQVSGTAKKFGGSGLGLAICKAITTLHGGRIWVESVPHKGTTFTVELDCVTQSA